MALLRSDTSAGALLLTSTHHGAKYQVCRQHASQPLWLFTMSSEIQDIDSICDKYELGFGTDQQQPIEELITGWEEPEKSKLLFELLCLDWELQRRLNGTRPNPSDYYRRFPDAKEVIDEAFLHGSKHGDTIYFGASDKTLLIKKQLSNLREHKAGGLGKVFEADDQALSQTTAIKFLHNNLCDDPDARERLRTEAQITAQLEHPGVVPVYGFGETQDGRLFYVMRFVKGDTLGEQIDKFHEEEIRAPFQSLAFRKLTGRFMSACNTIAFAHENGIIHRDIKPANILIGDYGETLVVDWGLATNYASPTQTSKPAQAGTPGYMSPEQARAEVGTPASDIFSLGRTLYYILTGQSPLETEPVFPLPRGKGIPKPLEAICRKATSLKPSERFQTAEELVRELERFLGDEGVQCYAEPFHQGLLRWGRKHRTLSLAFASLLLLLAFFSTALAVITSKQSQKEREMQKTEHSLRLQSLKLAANLAAETVNSTINSRMNILLKEAERGDLVQLVRAANEDPNSRETCQQWLDDTKQTHYPHLSCRSWTIQDSQGTQIARWPKVDEASEPIASLGRNYAFRDYFHGQGEDYPQSAVITTRPLTKPHVSVVTRSTNDGELTVSFSVPIKSQSNTRKTEETLGVLSLSVSLGRFFPDLHLGEGQGMVLVDGRNYYLLDENLERSGVRGEGLILHHDELKNSIRHVEDETLKQIRQGIGQWETCQQSGQNMLEMYRDPLSDNANANWQAAYAPVILQDFATNPDRNDMFGWYLIVHQQTK